MTDTVGRLLKVNNRHGLFSGDIDKVAMVLRAFDKAGSLRDVDNEDVYLMQSYMNEACYPAKYSDVKNRVELAIMIVDITPMFNTPEEYRILANQEAGRG